jgi:hypothetical protein
LLYRMVDTPVHEAQQDEQRGASIRARMGQYVARASNTATAREGRRSGQCAGNARRRTATAARPAPWPTVTALESFYLWARVSGFKTLWPDLGRHQLYRASAPAA